MANLNCEPRLQQLSILRMFVFVLLALTIAFARSDATIQSSDGEEVYCVDKLRQPAFDNPLLKHHKFQDRPSEIPTKIETIKKSRRQTFEAHISTANCPDGTVPIRPDNMTTVNHRTQPSYSAIALGHEYAYVTTKNSIISKVYGTKATINVWKPAIEIQEEEMTVSQIWITSGQYESDNLNTIEVGWQILPRMYKDNKPRLFIYWTVCLIGVLFVINIILNDAYITTRCYNVRCPGFIQTSSSVVIGGAIKPISSFGGSQFEITIHVWKDKKSGNWWLSLGPNDVLVGYWPNEIFTTLGDHAENVKWGGEILNLNTSGQHTMTQMGSGHFANEGFRKANYFRNLMIVNNNNNLQSIRGLQSIATDPEYYNIKDKYTEEWKTHFFYGGPGFKPSDSEATLLALNLTILCFLFNLFL